MNEEEIRLLWQRYIDGETSAAESKAVLEALADNQKLAGELVQSSFEEQGSSHHLSVKAEQRILANIFKHRQRNMWIRIAAAAAVLLFVSVGIYIYTNKNTNTTSTLIVKNDVAPGGNKAILTLSNGEKIVLDNKTGKIATQAGKQVMVAANGSIAYNGQSTSTEVLYNTLTVPIGNHRDLELPDGSKVSLDAGSSITYPVVFDKERKISMTGQAYFVVKHDSAHPFLVATKGQTTEDIGTEFNIYAYDDEPAVKTTLIEGSIKVNTTVLKVGEQANFKDNNVIVKSADVEAVTAWRDNNFLFRNQGLKTTMRQIARWYNVNIIYDNAPEKLRIWADISRNRNLSVVLNAIQQTGKVKFTIDGRDVHVSQ